MTGKLLDRGSPGALVFILPIALAIVLLLNFWPILLLVFFLGLLWKLWENYQWNQWCKKVNPFFYGLIKENQGCLIPIDLSLKANLTASAAQRFLEKKSEEFGAQRQVFEDKGTVYYFLTASALGQIFEDSEPEEKLDPKKTSELTSASSEVESNYQASSVSDIAQLVELENKISTSEQPEIETTSSQTSFEQTEETISSDNSEEKSPEETTSSPTEVEVKEQLESDPNSDVVDLDSQKHNQTTSYTVSSESASEVSEPTQFADESNSEQPETVIAANSQVETEAKPESDPETDSNSPVSEQTKSTDESSSDQPEAIIASNSEVDTETKLESEPEIDSNSEKKTLASGEHQESSETKNNAHSPLIQSELAKRLDLHSSTIAKKKSDPDFTEWSQSKDPEGIGWKYSRKRRVFLPVES